MMEERTMSHQAPTFNKDDKADNALGQAVWTAFCHERRYIKVAPQDRPGNIEVVDGVLNIRPGTFKPGFLFAHEIGHILEASDEELFQFNLGMGDVANAGHALKDEEANKARAWREAEVLAIQFNVTKLATGEGSTIPLERAGMIFGHIVGDKAGFKARLTANLAKDWDVKALWERKLELVQAARRELVAA
jgi:hypothetical protein